MTPEEWAKLTDLLGDVLDLSEIQRTAFLARLEQDDPRIAREVMSLLNEHERPGDFLTDLPTRTAPAVDLSGRTLGSYRLIHLLGSGGMGTVYLAERNDGAFSKQVAVKLLSPAFAQARERFHRERELLARLEHPNIARLLDGGTSPEGWPYLVMEYVEGVAIDRYCAERDLSVDARLALMVQVCAGVAHAHQRLVIHCDIKPENILVTSDGTAKLLDFGIAKLLEFGGHPTQLRAATPAFSSPEQLQGDVLTTASDVYSIGVLGYLLITGGSPYALRTDRAIEAIQAVLSAEPVAASRIPGLPPARARRLRGDLENILARAVAKAPTRRYASAQQLADDLEAFRHGFPVRARADTVVYRLQRFIGRHRMASAAALLSVVSLVAALAFSTWQARIAQQRFDDLRDFAHAIVFDVEDELSTIPGTTAARKLVVDTALRYLDRLSEGGDADAALREELASAYIRVGKVQGGAFLPNLGDVKGAVSSFAKAIAAVGPSSATARLERLRIEGHINIALLAADPADGTPEFDRAIAAGERLVATNPHDVETLRLLAQAYHGKATNAHAANHLPDHETAVARAIAIRERVLALTSRRWQDELDIAREHLQHALALSQAGQPAGALDKLRAVQSSLEAMLERSPANQVVIRELAAARSRAGAVLLTMGRTAESASEIEAAIDLLTPVVNADPSNRQYIAEIGTAWWRLAQTRRAQGRLDDALDLQRRAVQVSRDRARRDSTFMFIPWGLSMNLTALAELLLETSPPRWREARELFLETRDLVEPLLRRAPSFNELRKQLAISYEGLARAELAAHPRPSPAAREWLEKSLATWRDVTAHSAGDLRHVSRVETIERLLASMP